MREGQAEVSDDRETESEPAEKGEKGRALREVTIQENQTVVVDQDVAGSPLKKKRGGRHGGATEFRALRFVSVASRQSPVSRQPSLDRRSGTREQSRAILRARKSGTWSFLWPSTSLCAAKERFSSKAFPWLTGMRPCRSHGDNRSVQV